MKHTICKHIYIIVSVYAPQSSLPNAEKDEFYDELFPIVAAISTKDILILLGDWDGHVSKSSAGYEGVHDKMVWTQNTEGESLLEFAMSCNMVIDNTCFKKWSNHLITFTSGEGRTQID